MEESPRLKLINGDSVTIRDHSIIEAGKNASLYMLAEIIRAIGKDNYALRWKNGLRISSQGHTTTYRLNHE